MGRSGREPRDQVWKPDQEDDYHDAIDSVFGAPAGQTVQTTLREAPKPAAVVEIAAPLASAAPPAVEKSNVATLSSRQAISGGRAMPATTRPPSTKRVSRRRGRSIRPPEASIAYAVYTRLLEVSAEEKHRNGLAARPCGVIVMDALDRHAATLAKRWTEAPAESATSNSLFVRSGTAVLRRRRTGSKKTIPLSGISGENRNLLDRYAIEWNAGGRSALVEEALRLEFGMPLSDDAAEDSRS